MASSRRGTRENMFSAAQKTAVVVPAEKSEIVLQEEEKAAEKLEGERTDRPIQPETNLPKAEDTEDSNSSVAAVSTENTSETTQNPTDVSSVQESDATTNHESESEQSFSEKIPIPNEVVMQMFQQFQKAVQENMQPQPQPIIKDQENSEIITDDQNENSQKRVIEQSDGKWAKGFSSFKESAKRKKAGSTRSIYFDTDILNYLEENSDESGTSLSKLVNYLLRKAIEAVENGQ